VHRTYLICPLAGASPALAELMTPATSRAPASSQVASTVFSAPALYWTTTGWLAGILSLHRAPRSTLGTTQHHSSLLRHHPAFSLLGTQLYTSSSPPLPTSCFYHTLDRLGFHHLGTIYLTCPLLSLLCQTTTFPPSKRLSRS
jgi:membrane associated rhomboid family serine protease